ncbi:thiol-disulfide isomerase/thioredoxin [Pedobacter sp. UYP30]|uniref:TlpA family protein disulfide reductase n=1 Tax=Pedobacter sp. UYP30 TaxID=1756400 RepID=UPI00339B5DB1
MNRTFLLVSLVFIQLTVFAQNVKVTGVVKNGTDSIIEFSKMGQEIITRESFSKAYEAKLNNKGGFEIVLPNDAITGWILKFGDKHAFLDLQPGHDVNLTIDMTKDEYPIFAVGANSAEANFENYLIAQRDNLYKNDFYQRVNSSAPKDALKLRKEQAAFELTVLEDYKKSHPINNDYDKWLKTYFKYQPYERTLVESGEKWKLRSDSTMVAMLLENGINDDYAARNSLEYNDLINLYMHYHFNGSKFPFSGLDYFNFGINSDLRGVTKQMFLTRQMAIFCKTPNDSTYNSMYEKFANEVADKDLISFVDKEREKYLTILADGNHSKENVSESASLNEIFKKYKGKVIYLDFWASWCAPCKIEMPNAVKLKDRLKGKDVVFLYFGFQDRKESWLAARKEIGIEGDHYLLSPKLIKEAKELFEIGGIPHYAIIDKDGTVLEKSAQRPSFVYDELLQIAGRKDK